MEETFTAFQNQGAKETNIFQEPLLSDVTKSVDWRDHGYVTAEKDQNGPCRCDPKHSAANITGSVVVPSNEDAIMKAVATVGPISIGISIHLHSLIFYKSGLCYDPDCYHHLPNYADLLVGCGEESNGQKYWLLKNSWGEEWGMDGYIKMAQDRNNHCAINTIASYPIV